MIQILMLISALGIWFLFKYLTWFLDDSYDEEEKIIEEILTKRNYKQKVFIDNLKRDNGNHRIPMTVNNEYKSGFKFYSFENKVIEEETDNSNTFPNDRCA